MDQDVEPARDFQAERVRINLAWCVKLRWAAVAGQLATIGGVAFLLGIELPLGPLLGILGAELATNLVLEAWSRRQGSRGRWNELLERGERVFLAIFLIDLGFLTALLYLTGGPENPFAVFYIVNLVLAVEVLRPARAWFLTGVAVVCYTALLVDHRPLAALRDRALVVQGNLAAFAGAASIIVYLLTRLTAELARRERELAEARQREAQRDKLDALATLAAGAAHELASPLSTIAVVAKELEIELGRRAEGGDLVEDARLVRTEVTRCRAILDLMSRGGSQELEEQSVRLSVDRLAEKALEGLPDPGRVRVDISRPAGRQTLVLPESTMTQTLRALLRNAVDASPPDEPVRFAAYVDAGFLELRVVDRGAGMDRESLSRAFDPFYTTKEPGEGMGLGLFLAKATVERLGGSLSLETEPGAGTRAVVRLPLHRVGG